MFDRGSRGLGDRVAQRARYIYTAGVLALTEPGPAAAGVVVADENNRSLAHRAQYVGTVTRHEAAAEALLAGLRLAEASELPEPHFRVDDPTVVEALKAESATLPAGASSLTPLLRELVSHLPNARFEVVSASANPARSVALAPLVDWLPERARRAEDLRVFQTDGSTFEVESASQPGQRYRVRLRRSADSPDADPVSCECADFEYRGIPCKHVLAAARQAGLTERLFYPESAQREP
jgi:hypothetical protein